MLVYRVLKISEAAKIIGIKDASHEAQKTYNGDKNWSERIYKTDLRSKKYELGQFSKICHRFEQSKCQKFGNVWNLKILDTLKSLQLFVALRINSFSSQFMVNILKNREIRCELY